MWLQRGETMTRREILEKFWYDDTGMDIEQALTELDKLDREKKHCYKEGLNEAIGCAVCSQQFMKNQMDLTESNLTESEIITIITNYYYKLFPKQPLAQHRIKELAKAIIKAREEKKSNL